MRSARLAINKSLPDVTSGIWLTSVFPGLAIVLLVLGISLIGESLNDVLNPLLRTRRLTEVVIPERTDDREASDVVRPATAPDDVLARRAAELEGGPR